MHHLTAANLGKFLAPRLPGCLCHHTPPPCLLTGGALFRIWCLSLALESLEERRTTSKLPPAAELTREQIERALFPPSTDIDVYVGTEAYATLCTALEREGYTPIYNHGGSADQSVKWQPPAGSSLAPLDLIQTSWTPRAVAARLAGHDIVASSFALPTHSSGLWSFAWDPERPSCPDWFAERNRQVERLLWLGMIGHTANSGRESTPRRVERYERLLAATLAYCAGDPQYMTTIIDEQAMHGAPPSHADDITDCF